MDLLTLLAKADLSFPKPAFIILDILSLYPLLFPFFSLFLYIYSSAWNSQSFLERFVFVINARIDAYHSPDSGFLVRQRRMYNYGTGNGIIESGARGKTQRAFPGLWDNDLEGGTRPCIIPNKLLIVGWIVSRVFMKPLLEIPSNYFYVPFSGIRQCLTCVHEKWNKIVPRLARHWLLFALRWFVRLFVLKRTKDQIWTSKVLYFYFELGYLFYRST